jgi:hypothetical protein
VDSPIRDILDGCRQSGDDTGLKYVKSFLLLRMLVGAVGIALPFALVIGERVLFDDDRLGTSLSGYYHTGVRDIFVGSLCAIGLFLLTYMAFHYVWDNVLSIVGGLAALGVALFPTGGPSPLTPVQEKWSEPTVSRIHFICAVVFILSLAAISFLFGYREGRKAGSGPRHKAYWRSLHWLCGAVILVAVAYVAVTKAFGWHDGHSILYGEAITALAFGVSWLTKGADWKILRLRKPVAPAARGASIPAMNMAVAANPAGPTTG